MSAKRSPRRNGGHGQRRRQEVPEHLQSIAYAYTGQAELEDARQLYYVIKRPRSLLGYSDDRLEAATRWNAPEIFWTREEIAEAAQRFPNGYHRCRRGKLAKAELLQLAKWFLWDGARRDAGRKDRERLERLRTHYCRVLA